MITSVDVAIVGLGPVGATLANFLGLYGVQTAVFERDEQVYPHPRAVHADDETLRILQATGLFDALAPFCAYAQPCCQSTANARICPSIGIIMPRLICYLTNYLNSITH